MRKRGAVMGKVVKFPSALANVTTDHYLGGCPHCGGNDGHMTVEGDHWCVCNRHKTKWQISSERIESYCHDTLKSTEEEIDREMYANLADFEADLKDLDVDADLVESVRLALREQAAIDKEIAYRECMKGFGCLFPNGEGEGEAARTRNEYRLENYIEVEPIRRGDMPDAP